MSPFFLFRLCENSFRFYFYIIQFKCCDTDVPTSDLNKFNLFHETRPVCTKENLRKKMENFLCGGYVFNSNFDSGNLAKVELVNLFEGKYHCT